MMNLTRRSILAFGRITSYSTSAAPPSLTSDDVDILINPSEKYLESFMEQYGNERSVFDLNTIKLWQNSFPNDYRLKLMCLKNTTRVIGAMHVCDLHPLDPEKEEPIVFQGFGWLDPQYRQKRATRLISELVGKDMLNRNTVSNINNNARMFWNWMANTPELPGVGSLSDEVGFNSYYHQDDLQVPDNLHFPDITVRDAREVPKSDIIAYDQAIHPYHRERYIISHLHDKNGFGKVAYDENGEVCGLGQAVIYPAGDCNVGPIYAESSRVGQAMFKEILKDIAKSGKKITRFEVRSLQLCKDSFNWIKPFLKDSSKHHRFHVCNLVFKNQPPKTVDFTKIYCPTHAQLFVI